MPPKKRADELLVERGLAETRSQAHRLVMAGRVRADGQVVVKPSTRLSLDADLDVERGPRYVSRGGEKLESALEEFDVEVEGKICADVGASTGGFTDCLLQQGATKVFAVDVGRGILHWKLRQDERVMVMEGTNARYVERLPEPVQLVTVDASFISLKAFLPVMKRWFEDGGGDVIALIKPQFEAEKAAVDIGSGVVEDSEVHEQVLQEVLGFAQEQGYGVENIMRSPLQGSKGNVEFLAHMILPGTTKKNMAAFVAGFFQEPAAK